MKEKNRRRPSLKVTLTASFLLFSAVLLIALWIIQTVFLQSFYQAIKTAQVSSCARSVSENLETDELYDLIADIEEQNSMFVTVYEVHEGTLTAVYRSGKNGFLNSFVTDESACSLYQKAVSAGGEYSEITQTGLERRFEPDRIFNSEAPTEALTVETMPRAQSGALSGTNPQDPSSNPHDAEEGVNPQNSGETFAFESGDGQSGEREPVDRGEQPFDMMTEEGQPPFDDNKNTDKNMVIQQPTVSDEGDKEAATQAPFMNDHRYHEPALERESVSRLAYAVINTDGDTERMVVVESEITPVTSVVETLRFQLIILTAAVVVISVVIALFTARSISKPISDTNEKAKSLAQQNYDVEFKGGRYKEIRELNDTLTYSARELKKVDTLRRELISNISHDLRTPLTMITGYSEVMRDLPGEMTPENIQIIIDEANRLNLLVTDILDISKLESGTADISKTVFSLTRCIESIFSRYTKLIENEGFTITFDYDEEVFVEGDELKLTQVLYNLINNAVNYVGEDKTVEVKQTVNGSKVRVDVIDHGEGISEEKLPYIWDRYYRVDKEHRQAKIGTGLGLSIVKNILKAHDADYGVESKEGEGSDFYFIMDRIQ